MISPVAAGPAWRNLYTLAENASAIPPEFSSSRWPRDVYVALGEVRDLWVRKMWGDFRMRELGTLMRSAEDREIPGLILCLKGSGVIPYLEEPVKPLQVRFAALCGGLGDFLNTCSETDDAVSQGVRALLRGETSRLGALMAAGGIDERLAWVKIASVYLVTRVPMLFGELSVLTNTEGPPVTAADLKARFDGRLQHLVGVRDALHRQPLEALGYTPERMNLGLAWFQRAVDYYPEADAREAFGRGVGVLTQPDISLFPLFYRALN